VWIALIALTVLALVFEPLGYPLAITLFMLALLRAYAALGWVRACMWAVAAAALSWFFFVRLLGVNLPLGLLAFGQAD